MNHARFFIKGTATGDGGSGDALSGGGYEVLTYKFSTSRQIDPKGNVASKSGPLQIELEIYAYEGKSVLLGMYIDMFQQVSGRIEFIRNDTTGTGGNVFRKLKFEKSYIVGYEENFAYDARQAMKLKLVISSGKIEEDGNGVTHDWAQ
jgi:hypothetical protein